MLLELPNKRMSFTNISQEQLEEQNLGQDIPYMLSLTPSVVTTSDAGAGIGYTGFRVRGSDATRINVTIDGIHSTMPNHKACGGSICPTSLLL